MGSALSTKQNHGNGTCVTASKDRVAEEKKNGVVYEVKCQDCAAMYIGETLRSLKKRLSEHRRHAKPGSRFDLSAVAEHAVVAGHSIAWDSTIVVCREQEWHPHKVKEALYINMKDPAMNKDKGMELSPAWMEVMTIVRSKPKSGE